MKQGEDKNNDKKNIYVHELKLLATSHENASKYAICMTCHRNTYFYSIILSFSIRFPVDDLFHVNIVRIKHLRMWAVSVPSFYIHPRINMIKTKSFLVVYGGPNKAYYRAASSIFLPKSPKHTHTRIRTKQIWWFHRVLCSRCAEKLTKTAKRCSEKWMENSRNLISHLVTLLSVSFRDGSECFLSFFFSPPPPPQPPKHRIKWARSVAKHFRVTFACSNINILVAVICPFCVCSVWQLPGAGRMCRVRAPACIGIDQIKCHRGAGPCIARQLRGRLQQAGKRNLLPATLSGEAIVFTDRHKCHYLAVEFISEINRLSAFLYAH